MTDMAGIEALNKLAKCYRSVGKRLQPRHLSDDGRQLLKNTAPVIEVNVPEDPHYQVAE